MTMANVEDFTFQLWHYLRYTQYDFIRNTVKFQPVSFLSVLTVIVSYSLGKVWSPFLIFSFNFEGRFLEKNLEFWIFCNKGVIIELTKEVQKLHVKAVLLFISKKTKGFTKEWEIWLLKLLLLCLSFYFHSILVFVSIKISMGSSKKRVSYGYENIRFPFLNFQKIQPVFLIRVFLINSYCVYAWWCIA